MEQIEASKKILEESQKEAFPYTFNEFGLEIIVHEGVFSPKHFHGWRVFTQNFPNVDGETVLEIGCGHGATSIYLAKNGAKKVVAVDINKKAVENTLENAKRNNSPNVEVRVSDVYSAIEKSEKFDTIYWNTPFIYVPEDYEYISELERGLFDPGYKLTERFLEEAGSYLTQTGRILLGIGDFGDIPKFKALAEKFGYSIKLLAKEDSTEMNPVDFQLYELRGKNEE